MALKGCPVSAETRAKMSASWTPEKRAKRSASWTLEKRESRSKEMTKHGHCGQRVSGRQQPPSPTYRSWYSLTARCTNPNTPDYPRYGGRGITVCERWREDFRNFLADMGERPAGTSIDRINNDGNYEPGNCRWATRSGQMRNRRDVSGIALRIWETRRRRAA